MSLALVIPVWNDAAPLRRLVRQASALGSIDQVVVIDDASAPPLEAAQIWPENMPQDRLVLIRAGSVPGGAGRARNLGLQAVATDHLLFFDADDMLTRELADLVSDLDGRDFDFCIFKHADSRYSAHGEWAQMPEDEAIWRDAGVAVGAISVPGPEAAASLAGIANYPWNKIYRTGFLRDHDLRCTEILTHNDVELHWRSFLASLNAPGRILTSDRVCSIHHVRGSGERLSNRSGAERLAIFPVLDSLASEILSLGGTDLRPLGNHPLAIPFLRFVTGLLDWISDNLDPDLAPALAKARGDLLRRHVALSSLRRLDRIGETVVVERLRRQMALPGGAP